MISVSLDATAIPVALTGAGQYVMELARALDGVDEVGVTMLTRRGDRARWQTAAPRSRTVDVAPASRPVRLLWEQLRLPARLGALGVDVHHAPHYTMPERSPVPVVVTIHDMTFFDHPEWHEPAKVRVFRRAITRAASRAAALVCVSDTTAQRFRHRFPGSAPVHVVPHGVNHARFRPDDPGDDVEVLRELGVAAPYVAFVGTIEPRKDVASLIAAFDRVAGGRPGLSLVIGGGEGWGDVGIDAALAAASHRARIHRLGYVPDAAVPALFRNAAAVAYPSRDEGFGLPVLEAMACGASVVTTRGTAMAEVAGDAAFLCDPGDVEGLAGALDTACAGVDAVRRADGLARAARYTWSASADGHVAVYRSVA